MFTPEMLKTVEAKILESCDKQDGISDGVIDDPRQCKFDVNTLPLSAAQKNALKVIYSPTSNQDGEIYPAQPFGGEGQTAGWPTVDHRRQAAAAGPGAEPALRIRHRHRQVPGLQRSGLGLQQVQLLELEEGLGAGRELPQRDESGSERVQRRAAAS